MCCARLTDQACVALPAVVDEALPHLVIDMGAEVVGAHLQADMSTVRCGLLLPVVRNRFGR